MVLPITKYILLLLTALLYFPLFGQNVDSLFNQLEKEMGASVEYTTATFKTTRVINGQSIERLGKGDLDFRINHRFGVINKGLYEFFGLDQANSYFNLEYGLNGWLMAGIGRTNWKKTYSGMLKFTILRQSRGEKNNLVTISYVPSAFVNTVKWANPERANHNWSRVDYSHQILIARKFTTRFSAQVSPILLHRNMVETSAQSNDLFATGFSSRFKITKRIAIMTEYFYIFTPDYAPGKEYYMPLSIGIDIETGGHVFQLHATNSTAMTENGFLGYTTGSWNKKQIHFGFNISRVFKLTQ